MRELLGELLMVDLDDSLDNFLEAAVSPEKYKLYTEIISYLESIEYSTIQDELLNIMYSSVGDEDEKQQKPESMICDEIYGHLRECLISEQSRNGITLAEEINLRDSFDVCLGLLHIAGYEDTSGMMASCYSDSSSVDKLAEILQLVTTVHADHWAHLLEMVENDVIKRILEICNQTVNSEYEAMQQTGDYLAKLRIYNGFIQQFDMKLAVFELAENTMLGQDFETYINSGKLDDLFEGIEMRRLGLELYGMALISSDAKNDPVNAIRGVIEKYLADAVRIVKLNSEVSLINAEFVKYYQTNVKNLAM